MNKDELQLILEEGEGYRIEFKESMTSIDKELDSQKLSRNEIIELFKEKF
ncbi:MAG: hypothetical protein ABII95_02105 [Patescibacteria group bacterium]